MRLPAYKIYKNFIDDSFEAQKVVETILINVDRNEAEQFCINLEREVDGLAYASYEEINLEVEQ